MVKLSTACRRGDSIGIYASLREDMAKKLESTESGRDYAAIAKSFIEVQEKIDEFERPAKKPIEVNLLASSAKKHARTADG